MPSTRRTEGRKRRKAPSAPAKPAVPAVPAPPPTPAARAPGAAAQTGSPAASGPVAASRASSATPAAPPPRGAWAALRDGGRPLLLLLLLALLLKLVIALSALADDPLARHPTSDAAYYLDRARGLLGVEADPLAAQVFHLPPLYPWLLACLPGIAAGEVTAALLVQAVGGALLLALVFVLARRRMSRPAAHGAAGLTLLYGPLSFYETRLLGDSLACLLLIGLLVAADALADALAPTLPGTFPAPSPPPAPTAALAPAPARGRGRGAALAALVGALVALAALLRPQALLLVPVLLGWILTLPRRLCLPFLAAAALVLAPATLHNLRASGDLILVSDNGGVNLWLASTGPVTGTFATDDEAFGDIERQADVARGIAELRSGRALSAGAVSSWFAREALAAIAADVPRFAERVLLRARALTESFETDIAAFPEAGRELIAPLALLPLPFGLLLGLAVAGAILGARFRPAPRLPLLAVAGMVVLTALLFFHYSRFRLPLVPLLALPAAAAWDRLRAGPVPRGRVLAAVVAGLAVTGFSLLPAPHHWPTVAAGRTSTGFARLALAQPGDRAAAEAALQDAQAALLAQPGFARAELLGARASLLLGDYATCKDHLDRLERSVPDYPAARLDRGFLHAIADPRNPFHDPAAARALVDELARTSAGDPDLERGLQELRRLLAR